MSEKYFYETPQVDFPWKRIWGTCEGERVEGTFSKEEKEKRNSQGKDQRTFDENSQGRDLSTLEGNSQSKDPRTFEENRQGGDLRTLETHSQGRDPRTLKEPVEAWRAQKKRKEKKLEEKEEIEKEETGEVVGKKEGAVMSIPGNEGRIARVWVNVRGGMRMLERDAPKK